MTNAADVRASSAGPVLDAPRLLLRPWVETDASAMFPALSDPEAMRHWNTPLASSVAEVTGAIRRSRAASPDLHAAWLAVLKQDGQAVGFVNYHRRDVPGRRLDIGYLLARPFWGMGLATEAVSALLSHCFGPLGALRAVARVHPDNAASLRLLAHLGFWRLPPPPDGEDGLGDRLVAFALDAPEPARPGRHSP